MYYFLSVCIVVFIVAFLLYERARNRPFNEAMQRWVNEHPEQNQRKPNKPDQPG
jgi:hypothetical protein